ncbi:leucine-rich repeat-containing protein 4C-like [Saccostrea cucullata]|uniref:leucine-rich repeat-containing protein 4C-like n=1 Tax=Saccostrea cuccullata TaxID=36930 RepID=UPI002ED19D88
MVQKVLAVVFLITAWNKHISHSVYIQDVITTHTPRKNISTPECPQFCVCEHSKREAFCSSYYEGFSIHTIPKTFTVRLLNLFGGLKSFPLEIQSLKGLQKLDLSRNALTTIEKIQVGSPDLLKELDLSSNDIVKISSGAFSEFKNLKTLSLSENKLQTFPKDAFKGLSNLKILHLRFNKIYSFSLGLFNPLNSLEELDLRNNNIHWIAEGSFHNLTNLKTLQLSENALTSLTEEVVSEINNNTIIGLHGNPWDCSCELESFLEILTQQKVRVSNPDLLVCYSPFRLRRTKLQELTLSDLKCDVPLIDEISNSLEVPVSSSGTIHCRASPENHAIGYWITPQGVKISHKYHQEILDQANITTLSHLKYKHSIEDFSELFITENNTLTFTNFRGVFNGTFTCVLLNSYGNDTATLTLTAVTKLFTIEWVGMVYGGVSALTALVFGLLVGMIKLCAINFCKCPCVLVEQREKPKVATDYTFEAYTDDQNSSSRSLDDQDSYDDSYQNEESPLKVPVNSPVARTPRSSPRKCATPTPEEYLEKGRSNTSYTLNEVKITLEKKMEKVRNRVHSIRESGSQYLTTIKDSGSIAANRVKAGVAMGVEQVKFGVMSMKEFCGTGEMAQTVSVVSVNTDVDSEERSTKVTKMTTL